MTLGQKITALRKSRGMTQEELSEAVGVTRQTISKWELDTSTPDLDYLCKLCDLFGVTADYLIRPERVEAKPLSDTQGESMTPPSPPAPPPTTKPVSGIRFVGWCLFILGIVLTQIALLFILFDEDSTVLWFLSGILIIIGLELFLIRWKPLFIVMWTAWLIWTVLQFVLNGSVFIFLTLALSWAMFFMLLWIAYTGFCIGATAGLIRKHIRAKRTQA